MTQENRTALNRDAYTLKLKCRPDPDGTTCGAEMVMYRVLPTEICFEIGGKSVFLDATQLRDMVRWIEGGTTYSNPVNTAYEEAQEWCGEVSCPDTE